MVRGHWLSGLGEGSLLPLPTLTSGLGNVYAVDPSVLQDKGGGGGVCGGAGSVRAPFPDPPAQPRGGSCDRSP